MIARITVYLCRNLTPHPNELDRSDSFLWHNNFKSIHLLVHGGGASIMTNFLLIILIASVWVNIWVSLGIAKSIDKPDFSKEDAVLKDATKKAQDELNKFPPQTN